VDQTGFNLFLQKLVIFICGVFLHQNDQLMLKDRSHRLFIRERGLSV